MLYSISNSQKVSTPTKLHTMLKIGGQVFVRDFTFKCFFITQHYALFFFFDNDIYNKSVTYQCILLAFVQIWRLHYQVDYLAFKVLVVVLNTNRHDLSASDFMWLPLERKSLYYFFHICCNTSQPLETQDGSWIFNVKL